MFKIQIQVHAELTSHLHVCTMQASTVSHYLLLIGQFTPPVPVIDVCVTAVVCVSV